ncbi:hypothetical protein [Methanolobus sp.]|uniref:hypothetical protein n=1 Tax=Methanolobus sp. TaxID=1874737 RepID=UPI0025D42BDC|nr:hypothetical protein [Methanolobus sp.]
MDDCPECPECPQENTGSGNNEASNTSDADMQAIPDITGTGSAVKQPEAYSQVTGDSVAAPGFGILFALRGIIVAARIKR